GRYTLSDVLDGIRVIGYPTDGSLTFYKAKLSPQWRFLIHTFIHCMSPKYRGWNQFLSSIASALICMPTGRTYNFSRFIMDWMIGNIGSKRHKFLMYPRFLQMILGIQTTDPSLRPTFDFTAKLFSNMKLNWDGPYMPLLAPMLVVPAAGDGADAVAAGAAAAHNVLPPSVPPTHSSSSIPGPSSAPQPSPVRELTLVREPTPVRESTPCPMREPTFDYPRPPSHPPKSEESNEAPQTPAATAAGGAEDSAALTALPLKLNRCINRVTSLENELGTTKKVLGGAVLKLVTRVKRLEGLLQQRKWRLVFSDSEGDDATSTEQDIDLEALHTLDSKSLGDDSTDKAIGHDADAVPADATMPFRRRHLRNSMDAAVPAAAAPSSFIPAVDKGKAPMVDDSFPADLLSEQERILKNLHDYQLGEDLAKKLHAEQEAEFARKQEELVQKAQAERVASPTKHGPGLSDQHRRELDAAQLIYTEADWVDLLAKIVTNFALSKQLLGDDVTEDNMNERLGMLLLRKRRELATQSRVKPMTKPQQRDYMRDFVKNNSASVYNQGWTMKKVPAVVPAVPSSAADVSVFAATTPEVPAAERRKHIAKNPIVDIADAALIKFDSDSGSDDDPLRHTKHFTSLRELLHMVEKIDLQKLLGDVDNVYQREDPDTFALLLWGDLHVLFQSLDDEDAHDFWRNQDRWRIRSWRLYPRAQVYILETVDGRVIYMFVDVSYPLSAATLERMLKHGLEVPKLLVGGDLTMAEQLISFIKAALLNAQSAV
nr:synaptobrevin, longin-like domain protein [Tanacetum cinerariifolium]